MIGSVSVSESGRNKTFNRNKVLMISSFEQLRLAHLLLNLVFHTVQNGIQYRDRSEPLSIHMDTFLIESFSYKDNIILHLNKFSRILYCTF